MLPSTPLESRKVKYADVDRARMSMRLSNNELVVSRVGPLWKLGPFLNILSDFCYIGVLSNLASKWSCRLFSYIKYPSLGASSIGKGMMWCPSLPSGVVGRNMS